MEQGTVVVLSDFDFQFSGYMNICINLCKGLAAKGYKIMCSGLNYKGEEHDYPFSIIPAANLEEAYAVLNNLCLIYKPQIVITALDIPLQQMIVQRISSVKTEVKFKHIGITAMENGPLVDDWALALAQLDYVFFISELGKKEAEKVGLPKVDHIVIGIDTDVWKPLSEEERKLARKNLGYTEDEFIVLTVADNQERKNLNASFEAVSLAAKNIPNLKHILVTREHNPYGYKLGSLKASWGIQDKVVMYERGFSAEQLRLIYGISDVFLLLSKGEGLGMPILEAMACGLPVVATDTGAITELLEDDRGYLVNVEYTIEHDTWGNSKRDFASPENAAFWIEKIHDNGWVRVDDLIDYASSRTWDKCVEQLHGVMMELTKNG